jgi:hemolysin III
VNALEVNDLTRVPEVEDTFACGEIFAANRAKVALHVLRRRLGHASESTPLALYPVPAYSGAMVEPVTRVKPKLRGAFHELGFYIAIALGLPLVLTAEHGRPQMAAIVFASSLAGCFGASALYHRPTWTPRVRSRLARLDHAGIYLLIAGTYTPFGLLVMSPGWGASVLAVVWSGAVTAMMLKLFWARAPKWLSAAIGLALGWVGVIAFPQLLKVELLGVLLVVAGGLLYSAGAIVYALRRPDPAPHVFGYHELFHVLTLLACGCQFSAIAFYVLPRG